MEKSATRAFSASVPAGVTSHEDRTLTIVGTRPWSGRLMLSLLSSSMLDRPHYTPRRARFDMEVFP